MTDIQKFDIIETANPVLTVAPIEEETEMLGATDKITALYCRLSVDDVCSFWYKDGSLQCTHKLVIDGDDFFFALAVAPHIGGLVNSDFVDELM